MGRVGREERCGSMRGTLIRTLILAAVVIGAASCVEPPPPWRFVFLADSRGVRTAINDAIVAELVTAIGAEEPDLVLFGGIDKRVLATTKADIDAHLERILPAMRERGGYIPTCDHGVPEEVSLENYRHYRKRCVELGG